MPVYPCLSPEEQTALLDRIVSRVRSHAASDARAVVVFDLDGTLMDNRPRSVAILRELAGHWIERHPEAARALSGVRSADLAYAVSDSLAKMGVDHPELVAEATHFWKERFFRDPYMAHDVAIDGAAAFAHAVHDAGAIVVYLTGRDLPLMGLGSWSSLRDLGFPIGRVGTELVCKPDATIPDEDYKREVAPTLARLGEVVASFDNEPGNCNAFLRAYPASFSVLLDTQHADGAPPLDAGVQTIRDFRT